MQKRIRFRTGRRMRWAALLGLLGLCRVSRPDASIEFAYGIDPSELPGFDPAHYPRFVRILPILNGDFDGNSTLDCADIDALIAAIVSGDHADLYDLTNDRLVDRNDRDAWLTVAGAVNLGFGRAYQPGDADLDGTVDGSDFGVWNSNKFSSQAAWCRGDFSADGVIDGSDFNLWNGHKFTSSDSVTAVPEPSCLAAAIVALGGLWGSWTRRGHGR